MIQALNTLFVTLEGTYLRLDHETLKLQQEGKDLLKLPMHHIGGVVVFGNVLVSPFAISRLAEDGKSIVFLDRYGRFKARVQGPVSGNVLLRKAQHDAYNDHQLSLALSRAFVAGKIKNAKTMVNRAAREANNDADKMKLKKTAEMLKALLISLKSYDNVEQVRGVEGSAARAYFSTFSNMIKVNRDFFEFTRRTRRPPRDAVNCLISFIYTLLLHDCISALESVGLDPQVGFLHELRPGRPSLALDLLEEFRTIWADRLALALINRKQLQPDDFEERPGGSVTVKDKPRKGLLVSYQQRKQDEVTHPVVDKKMPMGLIPFIQARLLARRLRGDIEQYIPYIAR